MQKTTNYQLNQWDSGDRILREDFNQDNKKLDDAIAALRDASPLVKLLDVTLQSSQAKAEISLSGLDLTPYRELLIYPKFSASTTENNSIYLTVNDLSKYSDDVSANWPNMISIKMRSEAAAQHFSRITLLLGGVLAASQTSIYLDGSTFKTAASDWRNAAVSAEELTKIAFVCSEGLIGAGSRISVLGIRV